ANFTNAVDEVRERLEGNPLPLNIPIGSGSVKDSDLPFAGIIDLLEMKALYYDAASSGKTFRAEAIPETLADEAQHWRENLFEVLTRKDDGDKLTSAYLEGHDIPIQTIRQ